MDTKNTSFFKITPSDIRKKEFAKSMWGYSPKEVDEFLDEVVKAYERSLKQEKDSQDKIQALSEELLRWKGREAEIEKLKEQANRDGDSIRAKATDEANKLLIETDEKAAVIRKRVEEWLERVIDEVEETERRKNSFMTAFRSSLDSHYELLKQEQQVPPESLTTKLQTILKSEAGAELN